MYRTHRSTVGSLLHVNDGWAAVEILKPVWYQVKERTGPVYQILPLDVALDSTAAPVQPMNESVAAPRSIRTTVTHHIISHNNHSNELMSYPLAN